MATRPAAATNESVLRAALIGTAVAAAPFVIGASLAYLLGPASKNVSDLHSAAATASAKAAVDEHPHSSAAAGASRAPSPASGPPSTHASTAASPEASPNPRAVLPSCQRFSAGNASTSGGDLNDCGNVLSTVNLSLAPVDPNAASLFGNNAAVIFLGPAGGKSHLSSSAAGSNAVIDAECWVSFRRSKHHLSFDEARNDSGNLSATAATIKNWEHETDFVALFFRAVVPITLSSMVLGRTVAFNIINDQSIALAAMFTSGCRGLFVRKTDAPVSCPSTSLLLERHRVAAGFVEPAELDKRLQARCIERTPALLKHHLDNSHFNWTWHRSCHTMISGAAAQYSIPLCPMPNDAMTQFVSRSISIAHQRQRLLQLARDGFHIVHFEHQEGTFYTLLEVLPLQWALFKGQWPGLTPSYSGDDDSSFEPPELVSWFVSPFVQNLNEEAIPVQECDADVAAAVKDAGVAPGELRQCTWLRQSGYVAPTWGSAPTPFRAILLLSSRRKDSSSLLLVSPGLEPAKPRSDGTFKDKASAADGTAAIDYSKVSGVRVKMLQPAPGGYCSRFVPTWHFPAEFRGLGQQQQQQQHKIDALSSAVVEELLAEASEPLRTKKSLSVSCMRSATVTPASSPQRASSMPQQQHSKKKRKACIISYGSYSPWHRGHREVLTLAQETVRERGYDVVGSFIVPVSQIWPKEFSMECLKPWALRATIAQLSTADMPGVALDYSQGFPNVCVESLTQRLTAHFRAVRASEKAAAAGSNEEQDAAEDGEEEDVAIFWVNGSDITVSQYMSWLMTETANIHLLIIPRGDGNEEAEAEIAERRRDAEKFGGRMIVSDLRPRLHLSSTKIRQAVKEGRFHEAADMIGNDAAAAMFFWAFHEEEQGRFPDGTAGAILPPQFVDLGFAAPAKHMSKQ